MHFSNLNTVRGRGGHAKLPLGIAPGAVPHMQGITLHASCLEISFTMASSPTIEGVACMYAIKDAMQILERALSITLLLIKPRGACWGVASFRVVKWPLSWACRAAPRCRGSRDPHIVTPDTEKFHCSVSQSRQALKMAYALQHPVSCSVQGACCSS